MERPCKGIIQKAFGIKNALEFNQAFIGPHITKKHFEVKQDLIDFFEQQNIDIEPFLDEQDNVKTLDINGFCIHQIKELYPQIIVKNGFCSYENNDLFTHGGKAKNLLEETSQFHGYKTLKYIVKMLSF